MQQGPYFGQVAPISPIPSGYLEGAANIGRTLNQALSGLGEHIGGAIEKYKQNEEERGILSGQVMGSIQDPTLLKYLKPEHVDGISKKIENGTVTNKDLKSFLPEVMIAKERYTRDEQKKAADSAEATNALQRTALLQQINARNQDVINADAYTNAMMGGPQTKTVNAPVTGLMDASNYINQMNGQPPPSIGQYKPMQGAAGFNPTLPSSSPLMSGVAPAGAAPAPSIPAGLLPAQSQPASEALAPWYSIKGLAQRTGSQSDWAQAPANIAAAPGRLLNEIGRYGSAAINGVLVGDYSVPREGLVDMGANAIANAINGGSQPQARQYGPKQTPAPAPQSQPAVATAPAQNQPAPDLSFNASLPPVGQTATAPVETPLAPQEKYANFVADYIGKGGKLSPEFIRSAKQDFGIHNDVSVSTKPIKDDSGREVAYAVIVDGKVAHIVEAPKAQGLTPEQALNWQNKVREQTVQFGGATFMAPSLKEAQDFREASANASGVAQDVQQLLKLVDAPGVKVPGTEANRLADGIATRLQGKLRVAITGPGAVNESEYAMLRTIIANPAKLWSIDANTKAALSSLGQFTEQNLVNKAKALGFTDATGANVVNSTARPVVRQFGKDGKEIK